MKAAVYKMQKNSKKEIFFAKSLEKTFKIYYNIRVFWIKYLIF